MALNAYLRLKGLKQGQIKGSCSQKGREDSIFVHALTHEIISPRDIASGKPTGKRQHKALTITKPLDRSSPLLYNLLSNNENITEWELKFWASQLKAGSGSGSEIQHYTVKLTNANVSAIRMIMPDNRNPELTNLTEYEEVSFTYQKISWTWNDGGIMHEDDWEAPMH